MSATHLAVILVFAGIVVTLVFCITRAAIRDREEAIKKLQKNSVLENYVNCVERRVLEGKKLSDVQAARRLHENLVNRGSGDSVNGDKPGT